MSSPNILSIGDYRLAINTKLWPCRLSAYCVDEGFEEQRMRGYFGIGIERLSKPINAGNLFRSAQAFGAGFLFTVQGSYSKKKTYSDTSQSTHNLPFFEYNTVNQMMLPDQCRLVGIELIDCAVELPTFKHPVQAAYVLGPVKGELSREMLDRCDHVIKIPASFCINVATAGAIVMYDRVVSLGRFGQRATFSSNPGEPSPPHVQGAKKFSHNKWRNGSLRPRISDDRALCYRNE